MMLSDMLKSVAPMLATAVAGPMGGAVVNMIAGKLGVEANESSIVQHLQNNPQDAAKLAEIKLEEVKAYYAEMDSARNREVLIAGNANVPMLNKLVTPLLALGVVSLSFVLFTILIFVDVQPEAKDILIYILGVLSAAVTQILSYYFGSSQGSKDKSDEAKLKGLLK
jgi:membrane protein YqaA with SNARE-associated domain